MAFHLRLTKHESVFLGFAQVHWTRFQNLAMRGTGMTF